ncbi:MAG: hypothetical protein Q8R70_13490, partial [Methanoregula sp.]|nr:hypothetical protein [Methanoregula sp.]
MTNLPAGRYLTIEAGTTRSAALGHDGSILWGGQAWTGSQLPQGNGYTDIALGPDYGFALKEAADEIILSGPISPDKPMEGHKRGSTSNDAPLIPLGSTIEHSDHDVTRIFGPDGTQLSWVNDKEAQKIPVSDTTELPVTRVFSVPSEAFVNQSSLQTIVVNNRTGLTPELSVISNIRPVNPSQAVTSGIYYQNIGGTVASVVGDDVFIAPLIQTRNTRSVTDLTYKYMRLNYDSGRDINIYCEGSGDMATCEGQVSNADDSLKRSESPAPQPLIFTIVPTDTTGNQPLKLSTETIASKDGSILHYTITATSSQTLPEIKISPAVFRNALENYTFMHGDQDVICYDTDQCRVAGDYIVSGTGNYLASGYVNFTVPAAMSNTGTPRNFNLLPDSDIILFEQPSVNARSLSAASSVPDLQIGGNDIWLWGIASENQNKENPGEISWVNIVIYNKNRFLFLEDLQKKSGGIWHHGSASAGNGNSGKSKAT